MTTKSVLAGTIAGLSGLSTYLICTLVVKELYTRIGLYVATVMGEGVLLLALLRAKLLGAHQVVIAVLAFAGVQIVLLSIQLTIWGIAAQVDLDQRASRGEAVPPPHTRKTWTWLLLASPIHVVKYHKLIRRDPRPDSPSGVDASSGFGSS